MTARTRRLVLIAAAAAAWALATAPLPAAPRWREVRTPNFLVVGDASAGIMKRIAAKFEQFHGVMSALTSRAAVSGAVPTVVLVFAGERSFQPFMPLRDGRRVEVDGVFWGGRDVNYVGINAEHGERAYPIVFHELTHLMTANMRIRPPLWVVEGLAEYYSTFEVRSTTEVLLGRPITAHRQSLRNQLIALPEFLAVDHQSSIYTEGPRRSLFYAQSWALVHLLLGAPDTRGRMGRFLHALDSGAAQEHALRETFGLDLPTLQERLISYVRVFSVPAVIATLRTPITETSFTATELPEGAALTHAGRTLLRQGRLDEAEERLRAALAAVPNLALAHASIAQLRLQQRRADEAWPHLEAAAAGAEDFFDHYLTAVATKDYVDAGVEDAGRRRLAMSRVGAAARAAAAARPDVAEAWQMAAESALQGGDLDEAARAAERAVALAPGQEEYRFLMADVLSRRGDFRQARALLGELIGRGQTPASREAARKFMATVVQREQYTKTVGFTPHVSDSGGAIPLFREVQTGETRLFGLLSAIECSPGGVTLVLRAGDRTLRITTSGFDAIEFITYRDDLAGQVRCAPRTPPDPVLVTWPGAAPDGDAVQAPRVIVEFTPRRTDPGPRG